MLKQILLASTLVVAMFQTAQANLMESVFESIVDITKQNEKTVTIFGNTRKDGSKGLPCRIMFWKNTGFHLNATVESWDGTEVSPVNNVTYLTNRVSRYLLVSQSDAESNKVEISMNPSELKVVRQNIAVVPGSETLTIRMIEPHQGLIKENIESVSIDHSMWTRTLTCYLDQVQ